MESQSGWVVGRKGGIRNGLRIWRIYDEEGVRGEISHANNKTVQTGVECGPVVFATHPPTSLPRRRAYGYVRAGYKKKTFPNPSLPLRIRRPVILTLLNFYTYGKRTIRCAYPLLSLTPSLSLLANLADSDAIVHWLQLGAGSYICLGNFPKSPPPRRHSHL